MEASHRPVLLTESLGALGVNPGGVYLDGTFGRGGHSQAILAALGPAGRLLALDRDPEAVAWGLALARTDARFQIEHAEFGRLAEVTERHGLRGRLNGVLLDLGVSSPQLDSPERGFSFLREGPLDMRMNPDGDAPTAAQWLAGASEREIERVLRDYGEERFARRIAGAIVLERQRQPLTGTLRLASIIAQAHPAWERDRHPATRAFQGIRIFLNQELEQLRAALEQALDALAVGGRLVVISFHSLEDRMVKRFFRAGAQGDALPRGLPVTALEHGPRLRLLGGPVRPGAAELAINPRARSAILRAAEKQA